ncbi:MAG: hypothetical protein F6K40_12270 [Okeania sp. SIO3I5]|uniref:hypothetical protein n=1 Tax=Okeania sp. SIO3I5 TaxID=2607805 RepID=UPI0013BA549A|nr:hypothetical protein [Okeania sp. SIO3I5]NEQ37005.1 hypothetical protein [Okeania sp. SIO3I5]
MPKTAKKGSENNRGSKKKRTVVNGVDPSRLWSEITSNIGTGVEYLKKTASNVVDIVNENVSYLREDVNPQNIVGGAKAVWKNITSGNVGFFRNWITDDDTPFLGRAAGIAAGLGGVVVGTIVGGKVLGVAGGTIAGASGAAKLSTASVGTLLANVGVTTLMTREQFVEKTFNFVETAVEVDINQSTEKFFAESVQKLQTLLKSLAINLAGLGGRTLARVVVDQTGKNYLEIDRRMLGILSLTMSETIMEDIRSSLANIAASLFSLGKDIASKASVLLSRDYLADLGIPGITKGNDKEEFTLSDRFQTQTKQAAGILNIPNWMQEALSEGGSEFYEAFKELADRAGIIDAARRQQIQFT